MFSIMKCLGKIMNKKLFNLLFIVFIGIFTNANAQISDNYYDVKIESDINKNISSNIVNSNIKITFKNKNLYNEQVKFSYHITDLSGKSIQFENERIPFQIDENGIGIVKLNVNFDNLTTPIDNNKFVIQFDLIDEKNLYWFKSNNEIKIESNDILYNKPVISHPKEIIKNSVEDNKVNDLNNILINITKNKYVLFVNIISILLMAALFLLYKKRNKKQSKCSDIYVQTENTLLENIEKRVNIENNSILYRIGQKLFRSINNRVIEVEKRIEQLNEHAHKLDLLIVQQNNDIKALITGSYESLQYILNETILKNSGLKPCEINKYTWSNNILYNYYITCCDIEDEFGLFDDIPYEVFADKISCYKNIVAIGQTSKEFIEYICYGEYIRNVISQPTNIEDSNLCPVALIGVKAKKTEAIVITNSNLSMVVVRSANILEELKDKISEVLYLPVILKVNPVEVEWKNFGGIEKEFSRYWRWAIDFDNNSSIIIHNNTSERINVSINFSVNSPQLNASISFKVNGKQCDYNISDEKVDINFDIELISGKNEIEFIYNGETKQIGADPRQLKFSIVDMCIKPENYRAIPINEIYGYNSISASTEDTIIRKRLHSTGFFEINAEIITKKGLYRKEVSSSFYSVLNEYVYSGDFLTEIRKIATELNRTEIPVLYTAYRKKVMR